MTDLKTAKNSAILSVANGESMRRATTSLVSNCALLLNQAKYVLWRRALELYDVGLDLLEHDLIVESLISADAIHENGT